MSYTPETTPDGWIFFYECGRALRVLEFFDGWYVEFN